MPAVPLPRQRGVFASARFDVSVSAEATVLAAAGELDISVAASLAESLDRELALRPPVLVVDAAAVTFCAARALTVLVKTAADAHAAGVPFVLVTRQRSVLRPLTALGLERVLPVYRDLAEALSWLALLPRLTEPAPDC
ncbi:MULTISPECIES: STAS domain-containing protein [unclassified Amycolatopsis]|uniref:STAS domain-containing protein n=1 Tax=unclassified Amycolatopsis TaxID=2618356 RepID=UPI002E146A1D|nr:MULTISPECIES: STAS domain-containing protein [unclassified Amycolatopsis]WSK77398.1 STAS domain-containing protein [Amycolatopsis sp. NBC_01286]